MRFSSICFPLLAGALLLGSPARAQTPDSAAAPGKARRVRGADAAADSAYAVRHEQQRYLLDAIQRNRPISWIAPGGELTARPHFTAAGAPERQPRYLFSAYLSSTFVVVSQSRFAFTVDPGFLVRMRREGGGKGSYPIRTPSYHIGTSLYLRLKMKTKKPPLDFGGRQPLTPPDDDIRYQFLRLGVLHHSNGQEGAPFVGGRPNQLDGNFANNSLEAAYVVGARTTDGAWSIAPYGSYGLPFSADSTQRGRYLFHRVGVRLTREVFSTWRRVLGQAAQATDAGTVDLARRNKSRLYTELNVSLGLSRLDSLAPAERRLERRRFNAEVTAVYIPRWTAQTGIFLTLGYYGEDPYNIWYLHRYPFARVGIATAAFRNVTQLLR